MLLLFRLDYDQYYASLAASSAASAQDTPSGLSVPGSDDFGDVADDDDDRKPSVEYLDSLNDYRKRSRSREDEGTAKLKVPKMGETPVNGFGMDSGLSGFSDGGRIGVEVDAVMTEDVPDDDPVVYGPYRCPSCSDEVTNKPCCP
jgi:transcription initiation factor TFIIE subunit alpha